MISEQTVITAFCDKLAEYGIRLADASRLKLDGNWHRARVDGDRGGALNLSYKIYFDDRPAGFFEDHKRGVSGTFSVANGADMSPEEREAARAAWQARQREREAEQARRYAEAAGRARELILAATGDPAGHPYIQRKGITPRGVHVDADGNLLIPVYQDFGQVASVQTISAEGEKLFMPGGRMQASFHPILGSNKSRVLVCEGYATGAALSAATGHPAACAMSAGNMAAVVRFMRRKFPEREIIACPDNDWATEARTGRNPGLDAVADLGVRVLAPQFPADSDPSHTDWDDWLRHHGSRGELLALLAGGPDQEKKTAPCDEAVKVEPAREEPAPPREGSSVTGVNHTPSVAGSATAAIPLETTGGGQLATVHYLPAAKITADLEDTLDPQEDDIPDMYSEDNAALAFSGLFADDLRYVAPWGRWMTWRDQRWVHEDTLEVFDMARKVARSIAAQARTDPALHPKQQAAVSARYGQAGTIAAIERLARADRRHAATIEQWDADIWLLNTPAGVVDLRTGAIRPGDRGAHMTKITAVAPGGDCPTWLRFLDTATAGDTELIGFLQRMAGYALTGSTRDHALFFVYGTGGNGKGTFLNTLQWILGDYARSAPADMFTERKHEAHTTELARLMGARLVAAQETEEGKRWAEAKIKALTGGDPITARFMRQDDFEYIPQFKLVMTGNHKPGLRNVDEAIKRRLHLIPFTVTIPAERRDTGLGERLRAEAGGILSWCIEGCRQWQERGLAAPAAVLAATSEYMEQQDVLGLWMDEAIDQVAGFSVRRGDLYKSFKAWAEGAGEYVLPQKRWVAAMETRGFRTKLSRGIHYVEGVRIRNNTVDRDSVWD